MTLSTTIKILTPLSHVDVFNHVRQVLGIPQDHPYRLQDYCGPNAMWSVPGGFNAMVIVNGPGKAEQSDILDAQEYSQDIGPVAWEVIVNLDTSYAYRGRHGTAAGVHNYVIQSLMDKYPGLEFWAENEFDGEWHHNQLPYKGSVLQPYKGSVTL